MTLKIPASVRLKRRYFLLKALNKKVVEEAILEYLGILGWAKAAPFFVEGNKIILAVNRGAVEDVRASFELSGKDIRIIRVSGTLKGLGIK